MSPFVDPNSLNYLPLERETLKQAIYARLAEVFPGWEAAPGNLETVLTEEFVDVGADLADVAIDVPNEIFRNFGTQIANVPAQIAQSATFTSTWTMVDDAGYTIPVGTPVQIKATGSDAYAFFTLQEVSVPAGETTTATGEVVLSAAVAGSAPNGLEDLEVEALDNLAFVDSIEMETAVSGGVDDEDPLVYLNRLADELRTLSRRPILPEDFAILARSVPGVWRATAIDGYNPGDATYDNERMVSIAAIDEDGVAVGTIVKDAIDVLLEGEREINFLVYEIDPTVTSVKVSTTVVCLPGYTPSSVEDSVEAAITSYLTAKNWGLDYQGSNSRAWRNITTVRRFELLSLVDRVPGVDYVTALTLAKTGDSLATSDVTLTGVAPLPSPGVISCTAS